MTERAGNADRDTSITLIQKAYTDGYLKDDEMQDRISRAFEATYMSELSELVKDIPAPLAKKSHVRLNPRSLWYSIDYEARGRVGCGMVAVGLLGAVLPDVYIGESLSTLGAVWPVIMIAFIVVGVFTAIMGCVTAAENFDTESQEFKEFKRKKYNDNRSYRNGY